LVDAGGVDSGAGAGAGVSGAGAGDGAADGSVGAGAVASGVVAVSGAGDRAVYAITAKAMAAAIATTTLVSIVRFLRAPEKHEEIPYHSFVTVGEKREVLPYGV
jgi:hypothetical protein